MSPHFACSTLQGVAIGVVQVVLEVLVRELPDVFAGVLAQDGEGVGGHCGGSLGGMIDSTGIMPGLERLYSWLITILMVQDVRGVM